jgi:tRNA U34 5-methylaminomethyl-2-thiouridine-forming methyltransferase MnmC
MIELITTSDGSHSLLNTQLQETYHSVHGAIQHVFIKEGIAFLSEKKKAIRILEIGFGTGLNALLTWMFAVEHKSTVTYESWEMYPLDGTVVEKLNYGTLLNSPTYFAQIHLAKWNEWTALSNAFRLLKHKGDILTEKISAQSQFDLVYYDAFAPAKQPDMWSLEVLRKVTDSLSDGGVFVTYCAKGQVKRDLKSLGLTVETLTGPPGKKEMIRAVCTS